MVDCSETVQAVSDFAEATANREDMKNFDDVVRHVTTQFPELSRQDITQAVLEAHRARVGEGQKTAQSKLSAIKSEALTEGKTRETVDKLQQQLDSGVFDNPTPKQAKVLNSTLSDLKQQAARLNRDSKLRQRIDELTGALESDVLPEVKSRTETSDDELLRLEIQRDKLNQAVRQRREDLKPKSFFRKYIGNPLNAAQTLVRGIQTAFDISAPLRQGAITTFAHPVTSAKAFGPMLKALVSETAAKRVQNAIESSPNYPLYEKSGLDFSNWDGGLTQREEFFASNLAEKIPGVKGSERAYTTFLNKIRADSFDAMADSLGRKPTKEEAKAIANYINVATGRGDVGSHAQTFRDLSTILYAPRNLMSRLQYLVGQPLAKATPSTRGLIAKEYARTALGFGVASGLALASGATIEKDPRSPDFLKFKWGNTRVDMGAGLLQYAVLASRLISGSTKKASGEVVPIRGEGMPYKGQTGWDVATQFGRSKMAPLAGLAADAISGKQYGGKPLTALSAVENMAPLGIQDAASAIQEQGVPKGAAFSLLALMGAGVQTYKPYQKKW